MATAGQLVTQILNEILVRESESPMQADEVQDVIFNMNVYMLAQSANGINLGYTSVSDTGDTITVPDGALMGIIANVAIMMAPTFSATVSPGLITKAQVGMRAMRKLGVSMSESEYPSTLPIGSGNEQNWRDDHFYTDQESNILLESGGSIGLEEST